MFGKLSKFKTQKIVLVFEHQGTKRTLSTHERIGTRRFDVQCDNSVPILYILENRIRWNTLVAFYSNTTVRNNSMYKKRYFDMNFNTAQRIYPFRYISSCKYNT